MSKLEELIKEFCPNGVEYKPLEECCSILDNKRKPVTKSVREYGEYPYYGANGIQDYVSDYIFDGVFVLVGEDGSVLTSNGTPVVNWAEGKIWVNNHAHIIAEKEGILLRYLYHYLQTISIVSLVHGNIPKLTGSDFKSLQIPLPALPVQREIVRILDSFTLYSAELTAELTARRKQYEYYRDKLLTFDDLSSKVETFTIEDICKTITDFTAAGSFADIAKNVVYKSTPDFARLVRTMDIKSNFTKGEPVYVDENAFKYLWRVNFDQDCIILPNIGANCGEVYYVGKGTLPYQNNVLAPNAIMLKKISCNVRYLYHLLLLSDFQNDLRRIISPGGQTKFNKTELKKIKIKIPSIEVQERIVKVLDNFDEICSDLKIGLPAEIEARQKQYEYYRDKLLNFKDIEEDGEKETKAKGTGKN